MESCESIPKHRLAYLLWPHLSSSILSIMELRVYNMRVNLSTPDILRLFKFQNTTVTAIYMFFLQIFNLILRQFGSRWVTRWEGLNRNRNKIQTVRIGNRVSPIAPLRSIYLNTLVLWNADRFTIVCNEAHFAIKLADRNFSIPVLFGFYNFCFISIF